MSAYKPRAPNGEQCRRITGVLREHPAGLSTVQVAELCGFGGRPRQRGLSYYGHFLRRMERGGEITRSGSVPAEYNNVPIAVWRLAGPPAAVLDVRGGPGDEMQVDPLIRALVAELPPQGEPFPAAKLRLWLEALRATLELLYAEDDEPEVAGAEPK